MEKDILEMKEWADRLDERFSGQEPQEVLAYFLKEYKGHITLASSLGIEDQVLTVIVCSIDRQTPVFTLDTGRMFPETYSLIERTNLIYGIRIQLYFPDFHAVEEMVKEHGVNLFYESVEKRRLCCHVRKLEPLKRAFAGMKVWICGLRHEQSVTRNANRMVEWDEQNDMLKVNPLIDWTEEQTWAYIRKHGVPYNKLHDQGFPSIGCQPCTRAVQTGEDIRAGRWWWESPEHKECGLHG